MMNIRFYVTPILLAAVCGTMYAAVPVPPQERDGNMLLKECIQVLRHSDGEELNLIQSMKTAHCLGYLNGFQDAHEAMVQVRNSEPVFCLPGDAIRIDQLARILVKWLRENPGELHRSQAELLMRALVETFPCTE